MGFFDGIETQTTNPLFLGGAALLTGEGMNGAMKGMQMGQQFTDQRKKQQDELDQKQRWGDYLNGGNTGLSPQQMMLAKAFNAPQGLQFASGIQQKAPELAMEQQRLKLAQSADARAGTMQAAQLQQMKLATPQERAAMAVQHGLAPGSHEYQQFVLTGALPSSKTGPLETAVAKTSVDMAEGDIKAGYGAQEVMGHAGRLRDLMNEPHFEAAIGPIAGSSLYQTGVGGLVPFSETLGFANRELNQKIEQTKQQVVQSAQQRLKGLGPMSDADAARVEKAVGNLEKARDKKQFANAVIEIERSVQQTLARAQVAAKQFPQLGSRFNVNAAQAPQGDQNSVGDGTRRVIGEKSYVRRNGQWFEE